MNPLKILWVDARIGQYLDSGIALLGEQKVWFRKVLQSFPDEAPTESKESNNDFIASESNCNKNDSMPELEETKQSESMKKILAELEDDTTKSDISFSSDDDEVIEFEPYVEPLYDLLLLNEELIATLEKSHAEKCEQSGAPLFHGDRYTLPKQNMVRLPESLKENLSEYLKEEGDIKLTPMVDSINCVRSIDMHHVNLEIIKTVKLSEFQNYYVC